MPDFVSMVWGMLFQSFFLYRGGSELKRLVGDILILFVLDKITEMKNWIDDDICVIMIAIFFSWTILHQ